MFGSGTLVGVYLNDHLAGSTFGVELARRIAALHRDSPSGAELAQIATEVDEDRTTLLRIMAALGTPVERFKVRAARAAEKASRLKLNGRRLRRSPLSDLMELEAMTLGVEGKAAGWRALRSIAEHDSRLDVELLDALLTRARAQSETLEKVRARTADGLFGSS